MSIVPATDPLRDDAGGAAERHCSGPPLVDDGRAGLISPADVEAVADIFKLLGDPTRVRLLDALSTGERCVCDLAALLGLSESAVSHQLRLLRGARLVRVRRTGRLAFYAVHDHHVLGLLHDTRRHVEEPGAARARGSDASGS